MHGGSDRNLLGIFEKFFRSKSSFQKVFKNSFPPPSCKNFPQICLRLLPSPQAFFQGCPSQGNPSGRHPPAPPKQGKARHRKSRGTGKESLPPSAHLQGGSPPLPHLGQKLFSPKGLRRHGQKCMGVLIKFVSEFLAFCQKPKQFSKSSSKFFST